MTENVFLFGDKNAVEHYRYVSGLSDREVTIVRGERGFDGFSGGRLVMCYYSGSYQAELDIKKAAQERGITVEHAQ